MIRIITKSSSSRASASAATKVLAQRRRTTTSTTLLRPISTVGPFCNDNDDDFYHNDRRNDPRTFPFKIKAESDSRPSLGSLPRMLSGDIITSTNFGFGRLRPHHPRKQQTRGMAIKRKSKKRQEQPTMKKKGSGERLPLMNEKLVRKLMEQAASRSSSNNIQSPEDVQLRLVIEKPSKQQQKEYDSDSDSDNNKAKSSSSTSSKLTNLADAVQISLDTGLDLMEIDISDQHEIPIIRATNIEAKIYQQIKSRKEKEASNSSSQVTKEFRFKARTADYDLQRKINSVMDALKRGNKCRIVTTCTTRMIQSNIVSSTKGAMELMERIVDNISNHGEPLRSPELNNDKTHANVLIIPTTNTNTK